MTTNREPLYQQAILTYRRHEPDPELEFVEEHEDCIRTAVEKNLPDVIGIMLHPVTLAEAKAYIERHHRHHPAPVGHRFSIGVADQDATVRGVIVVGRPVARHYDDGLTAEVTRCATDGTRNAASMLYGAAWRAAKALGYRRLITYTRADESGASLRGAGWTVIAARSARPGWSCSTRPRVDTTKHGVQRTLWEVTA